MGEVSPEALLLLQTEMDARPDFPQSADQEFLDLAFSGDPTQEPEILEIWPLQPAEMEEPIEVQPVEAHAVARLRFSHHEAARMFALGARDWQVAEALGYSTQTVYLLRRSPAFANLVLYYTRNRNASVADVGVKLDALLGDGLSVLHERVLAGQIKTGELTHLTMSLASRRGHPETTRSQTSTLNVTLSAEEIEAIKQGVREVRAREAAEAAAARPPTIEGELGSTPPNHTESLALTLIEGELAGREE